MNGTLVEEKAGRQFFDAMTPLKAALMRAARMEGREAGNATQKARKEAEDAQERCTIARLWRHFENRRGGGAGKAADKSCYKRFEKMWGHLGPEDMRTAMLEEARDLWLDEGLAAQTVKHTLGLLRRVIRHGASRGLCDLPEPKVLSYPMPRVDNARTECLSQAEAVRLLLALDAEKDQRLASMVRFALVTGMRRGALLRLRWEDVDMQRDLITLRGTSAKKGRTDILPLTSEAKAILVKLQPCAGLHVFGCDSGPLDKGLRPLLQRVRRHAQLPEGFRPLHGLRHTYASWLASSGMVDLYTLQKLLTHENVHMTQRYAHLADTALRRAAKVADQLYKKVSGGEGEE